MHKPKYKYTALQKIPIHNQAKRITALHTSDSSSGVCFAQIFLSTCLNRKISSTYSLIEEPSARHYSSFASRSRRRSPRPSRLDPWFVSADNWWDGRRWWALAIGMLKCWPVEGVILCPGISARPPAPRKKYTTHTALSRDIRLGKRTVASWRICASPVHIISVKQLTSRTVGDY